MLCYVITLYGHTTELNTVQKQHKETYNTNKVTYNTTHTYTHYIDVDNIINERWGAKEG